MLIVLRCVSLAASLSISSKDMYFITYNGIVIFTIFSRTWSSSQLVKLVKDRYGAEKKLILREHLKNIFLE